MNKTLLKFTGLLFCFSVIYLLVIFFFLFWGGGKQTFFFLFCFSVIDVLVILYWWMRCGQTQSAFYCDSFMFGGILLILGIPALILLGLSLIILAFSKWYKGNVSTVAKSMIIILGIIIFVAPF